MEIRSYNSELSYANILFTQLFRNIVIERSVGVNNKKLLIPVPCVFATRSRILKSLERDAGSTNMYQLPLIAINRTGINRNPSRLTNLHNEIANGVLKIRDGKVTDPDSYYNLLAPNPIDISYTLNIVSKNPADNDMIMSNFIPFFNSDVFVTCEHPKFKNITYTSQIIMGDGISEDHPETIDPTTDDLITTSFTFVFKTFLFGGTKKAEAGLHSENCELYDGFVPVIQRIWLDMHAVPYTREYFHTPEGSDLRRTWNDFEVYETDLDTGIIKQPDIDTLIWKVEGNNRFTTEVTFDIKKDLVDTEIKDTELPQLYHKYSDDEESPYYYRRVTSCGRSQYYGHYLSDFKDGGVVYWDEEKQKKCVSGDSFIYWYPDVKGGVCDFTIDWGDTCVETYTRKTFEARKQELQKTLVGGEGKDIVIRELSDIKRNTIYPQVLKFSDSENSRFTTDDFLNSLDEEIQELVISYYGDGNGNVSFFDFCNVGDIGGTGCYFTNDDGEQEEIVYSEDGSFSLPDNYYKILFEVGAIRESIIDKILTAKAHQIEHTYREDGVYKMRITNGCREFSFYGDARVVDCSMLGDFVSCYKMFYNCENFITNYATFENLHDCKTMRRFFNYDSEERYDGIIKYPSLKYLVNCVDAYGLFSGCKMFGGVSPNIDSLSSCWCFTDMFKNNNNMITLPSLKQMKSSICTDGMFSFDSDVTQIQLTNDNIGIRDYVIDSFECFGNVEDAKAMFKNICITGVIPSIKPLKNAECVEEMFYGSNPTNKNEILEEQESMDNICNQELF